MNIFIILIVIFLIVFYFGITLFNKILIPKKINKIKSLFAEKKYDEVAKMLDKLLGKYKDDPELKWIKAQLQIDQGQYILAMVTLNDILKSGKYSTDINASVIHKKLAEIYEITGRKKEALSEYLNIVQIEPTNYDANFKLGVQFFDSNNLEKSEEFLKVAYRIDKSKTEAPFLLGKLMLKKDKPKESVNYLAAVLAKQPDNQEVLFHLGIAYYKQKTYSVAEEYLLRAIDLGNEFKNKSQVYLGLCYFEEEDYKNAIEYLTIGIKGIRESSQLWNNGMTALITSKIYHRDLQNLLLYFKKVMEFHPENLLVKEQYEIFKNVLSSEELIKIYQMDETEFPLFIKNFLGKYNFYIDKLEKNKDNSIITRVSRLRKNGQKVIELMIFDRYPENITEDILKDFFTKMKLYKTNIGFYITLFDFNEDCKKYVESKPIELYNGPNFIKILKGDDPF